MSCSARHDDLRDPLIKERRRPVWMALSDLCLDTEVTEDTIKHIASAIRRQEYTTEDAEYILFHEVMPPTYPNLLCVAGVWDGFDMQWLEDHILRRHAHPPHHIISRFMQILYRKALASDWGRLRQVLNQPPVTAAARPEE